MSNTTPARYLRVAVPVANLRRKPVADALLNIHDDLQETQLLFNELLLLESEEGDWLRVEAIEQVRLAAPGERRGYPGWVRRRDVTETIGPGSYNGVVKSAFTVVGAAPSLQSARMFPLSLGTRLLLKGKARKGFFEIDLPGGRTGWVSKKDVALCPRASGEGPGGGRQADALARSVIALARLFLGVPYFWGGRSMPLPWSRGPIMGVDCSGLVNLVFRAEDVDVPRDAVDQWKAAVQVAAEDVVAGDLIFISTENDPSTINHVMISLGGEQFIEAPDTGDVVRIRTFAEKMGSSLEKLASQGLQVGRKRLYFGRIGE